MNRKLNVLVACEESQAICKAFRALGHNAYSCDIQECSGGHPEWHIKGDVFVSISKSFSGMAGRYFLTFYTQDGVLHSIDGGEWDLIMAHPPCTYLSKAGSRYLNENVYGSYARRRLDDQKQAIRFFFKFTKLHCNHIAIENPIGVMSNEYRKPDQIIHPWQFGDNVSKSTCLWLKNLPPLVPTFTERQQEPDYVCWSDKDGNEHRIERFYYASRYLPEEERRKVRSKTFPGIAMAIAEQWSAYLLNES